jgi:hypothetical protein
MRSRLMTRFLSRCPFHHKAHDKAEPSLRETDPTAEEGARTKAAKPSNLLGFAFLLLTAYGTARPSSGL